MSTYRQGTVLGLTIAETFILLAFLLLIALLGFAPQPDEVPQICAIEDDEHTYVWLPEPRPTVPPPVVWTPPDTIATLICPDDGTGLAGQNLAACKRDLSACKRGLADSERELSACGRDLALQRKGENPPCWYQIVTAGQGQTREKAHYAFNAAIYGNHIELAPRPVPPGGADDDKEGPNAGKQYAEEWQQLKIDSLPYGKALTDDEFTDAVQDIVAQGRNRRVRSYECVFSVMVWDKTPAYAKKRWQDAHDRLIEGQFSAYTAQDIEWNGAN